MYPPPSGRHAIRCLYGIGWENWVGEMSRHALARVHSFHGVGEYSVFRSVAPRWYIFGPSPPLRLLWLLLLLFFPICFSKWWNGLAKLPRLATHCGATAVWRPGCHLPPQPVVPWRYNHHLRHAPSGLLWVSLGVFGRRWCSGHWASGHV